MAELLLHGKRIESVFQLLGDHENDITYSVGWALAHSSAFLQAFLDEVVTPGLASANVVLRLQEYVSGQGITDIEIESPGRFHLIAEAKRGWTLPTRATGAVCRACSIDRASNTASASGGIE